MEIHTISRQAKEEKSQENLDFSRFLMGSPPASPPAFLGKKRGYILNSKFKDGRIEMTFVLSKEIDPKSSWRVAYIYRPVEELLWGTEILFNLKKYKENLVATDIEIVSKVSRLTPLFSSLNKPENLVEANLGEISLAKLSMAYLDVSLINNNIPAFLDSLGVAYPIGWLDGRLIYSKK